MPRLFVAIAVKPSMAHAIASLQGRLRQKMGPLKVWWTPQSNLHLTLRFLGEVDEAKVQGLSRSLGSVVTPEVSSGVPLTGFKCLPSPRSPRVLALTLEPVPSLLHLFEAVERWAVSHGFDPEKRKPLPHLTIARFPNKTTLPPDLFSGVPLPKTAFEAGKVQLMESQLTPRGAVYAVR